MTGQISLKEAERKAFRAKTDDGLWDVIAAGRINDGIQYDEVERKPEMPCMRRVAQIFAILQRIAYWDFCVDEERQHVRSLAVSANPPHYKIWRV